MENIRQENKQSLLFLKVFVSTGLISIAVNSLLITDSHAERYNGKSVTLAYKKGRTIKVPQRAMTYQNGVPGVFVVENNQARFRMVRPGKKTAGYIYILAGLFGNETILLDNISMLFDGKLLK